MQNNIDISVVLPCYKEAENLEYLVPQITNTLTASGLNYEILVIDTITPLDDTPQICEKMGVKYYNRGTNNYFGSAIRSGIEKADGKYIVFMDADGSHSPEFLPELIRYAGGYQVVIASRYVDNGGTENTFILKLMSRVLNWTYSIILNIPCKDVSNSYRLYRGEYLKGLVLQCDNFDIVEEILVKLSRKYPEIRYKEVPYYFKNRKYGKTKRNLILFIMTYLYTLMKLRILK